MENRKLNEIFLEFSKNDMDEIEKIPGFNPIWNYPKLEKVHCRTWGYLIIDKTTYFFRVKNQEETLQEMAEGFFQMNIRIAGLKSLLKIGKIDIKNIDDEMKPLIDLCEVMITMYRDKKND